MQLQNHKLLDRPTSVQFYSVSNTKIKNRKAALNRTKNNKFNETKKYAKLKNLNRHKCSGIGKVGKN